MALTFIGQRFLEVVNSLPFRCVHMCSPLLRGLQRKKPRADSKRNRMQLETRYQQAPWTLMDATAMAHRCASRECEIGHNVSLKWLPSLQISLAQMKPNLDGNRFLLKGYSPYPLGRSAPKFSMELGKQIHWTLDQTLSWKSSSCICFSILRRETRKCFNKIGPRVAGDFFFPNSELSVLYCVTEIHSFIPQQIWNAFWVHVGTMLDAEAQWLETRHGRRNESEMYRERERRAGKLE